MNAAIKTIIPEYGTDEIDTKYIISRDEPHPIFYYRGQIFANGTALEADLEGGRDPNAPRVQQSSRYKGLRAP
ncbi:hypothetical protein VTI28DRAFT_3207 [Corynascus sepedonium]